MKKRIVLLMGIILTMFCAVSRADVPGFMKAQMGTLRGTIYDANGKLMPEAIVSFFDKNGGPPPVIGSTRRVPDMVDRSNAKGEFAVKLVPGTYYMGAMLRKPDKGVGPPRPGEKFYFAKSAKGKLREFVIGVKQVVEAGRVDGMLPGEVKEFKDFMTIKGKVTGEGNKPLSGVFVTLKDNLNASRPRYISEATAADGAYTLKVPPGKYYVVARESVMGGGRPGVGAYIGSYGKTDPLAGGAVPPRPGNQPGASSAARGLQGGSGNAIAVEGKKGEVVSNINIQMFKIPDPGATKKKFEAEAKNSKAGQPEGEQEDSPAQK